MKKTLFVGMLLCVIFALTACGGGGGGGVATTTTTQILSNPALDGDIALSLQGQPTLVQGNAEILFAGIHPDTGDEYRTFLNFPLRSASGIPDNAVIVSAKLDLFLEDIIPLPLNNNIPIRIELVSYEPPLIATDFDRTQLPTLIATLITPPISEADRQQHVATDVTALMQEAQRLGLVNFQLRISRDPVDVSPGLIVINDTLSADREFLAPLVEVVYQ